MAPVSPPASPESAPWWRFGIVWLVVGGPVVVVVAACVTAVIAWHGADPVVGDTEAAVAAKVGR